MVTKAHDMLNVSDFQTKAVTFCRISSKDQEKGVSIEAQIQNVKSYCTAHNLSIIREFAITESSIQGDRKQYHQMIQFIKSKKEKIAIVCNCVDRLQRSYKDTPELDTLRREGKIEVHFIKESLVLNKDSNGMSILFWNLNVLMANSYILSLSDNVKRSMKYNLANGKWQWKTPVAYLNKTSTDGKAYIELDQEKAKLVRKLFCDFSTGDFSITQLTQRAQQIGLTNNENQVISRSTIHRILTNPFYYGFMQIEKGTKIVPHIHGKIISKELFDKCQEILGNKSTKSRMNKKIFAFSGLLKGIHKQIHFTVSEKCITTLSHRLAKLCLCIQSYNLAKERPTRTDRRAERRGSGRRNRSSPYRAKRNSKHSRRRRRTPKAKTRQKEPRPTNQPPHNRYGNIPPKNPNYSFRFFDDTVCKNHTIKKFLLRPDIRQALGNTFPHTPLRIIALRVTHICATSLRTHQNAAFAAATDPNRPPRRSA